MATYRIVCTEQSNPSAPGHGHILAVGVGTDPNKATDRHTVQQVRTNLGRGDTYYTQGVQSGKIAYVQAWNCTCGVQTIRSNADAVYDNNLDSLRLCHFS